MVECSDINEMEIRGKPAYMVYLDDGDVVIFFDKKTLRYMSAEDNTMFGPRSGVDYGGRELGAFRKDFPGYYEYARALLVERAGGKKTKKTATVKRRR